jgi:hypothetical protein
MLLFLRRTCHTEAHNTLLVVGTDKTARIIDTVPVPVNGGQDVAALMCVRELSWLTHSSISAHFSGLNNTVLSVGTHLPSHLCTSGKSCTC